MVDQAKIEIRTRDVDVIGQITGVQHLFVIYTDSSGKEFILRGGTETNDQFAMIKDNIKIVNSPYEKKYEHLFKGDLIKNAPSSTIATGTDFQMKAIFDKMWSRGQEINAGKFDYKIPIPGCPASLCHIQNSNTVIAEVMKAAGLEMKLPEVNGFFKHQENLHKCYRG